MVATTPMLLLLAKKILKNIYNTMVTLSTIIYEGNFRNILKEDSWFMNFKSKFISKKRLNINNISSDSFEDLLKKFMEKHDDIEVSYVSDNIDLCNKFFSLGTYPSTFGYNYIMPYFSDILTVDTKYLLNIASDCQYEINLEDDFFEKSFKILEDEDVITTTIMWNKNIKDVGEEEQISCEIFDIKRGINPKKDENFWFSKCMSDQFFLCKIDDIKKVDFNINGNLHPYPAYGGFAFEKRLGNYYMVKNKYRAIYKGNLFYLHKSDKI